MWEKAGSHLETSYKYAGDYELWRRFFQVSRLHNVGTQFGGFRIHGDQLSVIYSNEYMKEAQKVNKLFPRTLRENLKFLLLKPLWDIRRLMLWINSSLTRSIAHIFLGIIDLIHNFPLPVNYDFNDKVWKKMS